MSHIKQFLMRRRQFLIQSALGVAALPAFAYPHAQSQQLYVPLAPNLPRPKFHFGQEVHAIWDGKDFWDDNDVHKGRADLSHNRATIVGMAYEPQGYSGSGWWYWHRWLDFPECPYMVGQDEGDFCPEEQFQALGE